VAAGLSRRVVICAACMFLGVRSGGLRILFPEPTHRVALIGPGRATRPLRQDAGVLPGIHSCFYATEPTEAPDGPDHHVNEEMLLRALRVMFSPQGVGQRL
jgi:hypothetical protein